MFIVQLLKTPCERNPDEEAETLDELTVDGHASLVSYEVSGGRWFHDDRHACRGSDRHREALPGEFLTLFHALV